MKKRMGVKQVTALVPPEETHQRRNTQEHRWVSTEGAKLSLVVSSKSEDEACRAAGDTWDNEAGLKDQATGIRELENWRTRELEN